MLETDNENTESDHVQDSITAKADIKKDYLKDVDEDEPEKIIETEKQVDSETKIEPNDEADILVEKKDDEETEISLEEDGEDPLIKDNNGIICFISDASNQKSFN